MGVATARGSFMSDLIESASCIPRNQMSCVVCRPWVVIRKDLDLSFGRAYTEVSAKDKVQAMEFMANSTCIGCRVAALTIAQVGLGKVMRMLLFSLPIDRRKKISYDFNSWCNAILYRKLEDLVKAKIK